MTMKSVVEGGSILVLAILFGLAASAQQQMTYSQARKEIEGLKDKLLRSGSINYEQLRALEIAAAVLKEKRDH